MSAVMPTADSGASSVRNVAASVGQPDRVIGAIERLALSRERLRSTMLPAPRKAHASPLGSGVDTMARSLVERIREMPGATPVLEALETWWQQHPLRTAALVASDAARKFAAPLAERNPVGLVAAAVVVGALLALSKPWRWLLRPAIFAGLVPAIATRVMRQMPVESWLRMFAHVTARTAREEVTGVPAATSAMRAQTATPQATSSPNDLQSRSPASPAAPMPTMQPTYSRGESLQASVP